MMKFWGLAYDFGLFELGVYQLIDLFTTKTQDLLVKNGQHYVIRLGNTVFQATNSLVQATANTVSYHGRFADFFADYHRQAITFAPIVWRKLQRTQWSAYDFTVLVDETEAAVAMKTVCACNHLYHYS